VQNLSFSSFAVFLQLIFYLQQIFQFWIQNVAMSFLNSARHIFPYDPYIVIILNFDRKCKMNCLLSMQPRCWRRSILDVLLCFVMIRLDWKPYYYYYLMNDFLTVLNIHCIPLLLQVEDLSRMYRLFSKITRGLEPISNMFKTVIISLAGCLFSFLAHSFYSFEPWYSVLIELYLSAACYKWRHSLGKASRRFC